MRYWYLVVIEKPRWANGGDPKPACFRFTTERSVYDVLKIWEQHAASWLVINPPT